MGSDFLYHYQKTIRKSTPEYLQEQDGVYFSSAVECHHTQIRIKIALLCESESICRTPCLQCWRNALFGDPPSTPLSQYTYSKNGTCCYMIIVQDRSTFLTGASYATQDEVARTGTRLIPSVVVLRREVRKCTSSVQVAICSVPWHPLCGL